MKAKGWIIIYMDDIFIFTKELQQNIKYTKWTLQQLQETDLYLKPEKCTFWMTKVEYLGLIIQGNLISMDPVKLNRIKDWLIPTTVKQVWSFLGFGNYYQWFIHGYGNLTQPLNDLLRKDEKFEWTPEQQDSFDTLKQHFTKSPVLLMPDSSKPFVLETDASLFASRAVLQQQDNNGNWHLGPTYPNTSMTWNKTMKSGIENSLLSLELWPNGDTICKGLHILSLYSLITKTWHTLGNHNDLTNDRLDAYWIQPETHTHTQNKNDPIWHALMMTRSLPQK